MSEKLTYTEFKFLEDLIRFVAFSSAPFLHHITRKGKHIYFVQILSFGGSSMVYYNEQDEAIKGKYAIFNRFRDEITFSDKYRSEQAGQATHVPIFTLKRTNILEKYPP